MATFKYDFAPLESVLADVDTSTLDAMETVYNAWTDVQEQVNVKEFAAAWAKQFKTRSATTIAINVGYVRKGVEHGFIDAVDSWSALVRRCNPAQSPAAKAAARAKRETEQAPLNVITRAASKLSKVELRRAIKALEALLAV